MTQIQVDKDASGRTATAWTVFALVGALLWSQMARADDDSWQKIKDNGLVVCAVDGLLPYSSSDAKTPGFEVEIAQALAKELGVTLKHEWVSWDGLIPALTSRRCDAIVDGMFITPEPSPRPSFPTCKTRRSQPRRLHSGRRTPQD